MKKITILLILILLFISGCTTNNETGEVPDPMDAYLVVIDMLYKDDSVLNENIKYLAMDTTNMTNLTEEDKEILLEELEEYGHTVLNMTFEELEEEGYIEDLYFKEGILLEIDDEPMEDNAIKMNASKWKSGLGAIGYDGMIVEYNGEIWEVTEVGGNWIS